MPRMSSDELLLRRFGQPRQASQPKEEEEEEEPGLDAQSARFGAYGTHKHLHSFGNVYLGSKRA